MSELGVTAALNINDLPFAADRTRAWRELREAGEAVSSGDEIILTSAEAVEFAAKRPEIFSSARAFDRLGSPVPLVPIAIDPPDHTRFRRSSIRSSALRRWPSVNPNYAGRLGS